MDASNQRKVHFSERWDHDDIIPTRLETSSTCKLHKDGLTSRLWNLDPKKIKMLKILHAGDAAVLARDRHRVHRDQALDLPYDEEDSGMAADHQAVYDIEIECKKTEKMTDDKGSKFEWERIAALPAVRASHQPPTFTIRPRHPPKTFNMFWSESELKPAADEDAKMGEDNQPTDAGEDGPAVTPPFPMFWSEQKECGEHRVADDESVQPLVEERRLRDAGENGPAVIHTFPMFWSKENGDIEHRVADDASVQSMDAGHRLSDANEDGPPVTPTFQMFWNKQPGDNITLNTAGEASFSMQLEFAADLPANHYLATPDRNDSVGSGRTAASYVVRQKQLTLDTCWDKGAANADDISTTPNIEGGDEESDIASTSVARSLAAAKIAKQKLQDAIAKLEDEHGRSSPTIDKKRDDLLSSMSQLEIAFNSVHVQQQLLDWLTPPTFIKKSLK